MSEIHPHQILCLECEETRLYGEVIQVIADRHLYWLRPLALVKFQIDSIEAESSATLFDLRQGADLLCPQALCRIAVDTEMMPILTQLDSAKTGTTALPTDRFSEAHSIAHQQLQAFIHRIWQVHPEAFRQ
ncbi:MAG: hypothetical protein HC827_02015 [Cyanobacteria bacterium RM1_2_2]|nr:hypothetical protein [Cyanobacteria bacterium RM1_2_2]